MARHPLPRLWLMTDERQDADLWRALDALPRGSGVVFRHYRTARAERKRLFDRVRIVCRRRSLVLLLAGTPQLAAAWQADGVHGARAFLHAVRPLLRSRSAHDVREARTKGLDLLFVSPVFATRSHADARPLGTLGFAQILRRTSYPSVALGGMTAQRGGRIMRVGAYGWAAIDAWSGGPPIRT